MKVSLLRSAAHTTPILFINKNRIAGRIQVFFTNDSNFMIALGILLNDGVRIKEINCPISWR